MYSLGDRVRVSLTAEDGLPLVRYGFVRSMADAAGPVVVMFDGEIGGEEIAIDQLEPVTVTSLDLRLEGGDGLLDDPGLRRGLAPLWQAEAEDAGLDVDGMIHLNGDGADGPGAWTSRPLHERRGALRVARPGGAPQRRPDPRPRRRLHRPLTTGPG